MAKVSAWSGSPVWTCASIPAAAAAAAMITAALRPRRRKPATAATKMERRLKGRSSTSETSVANAARTMREARTAAGLGVAIITHRYSATNAATGTSTAAAWPVLTPSSNIWTTGKATKIRKTTRAMLPPGPSRALRSAGGTSRDVVSVMSASWRTGPRSAEPAFTPQDRRREDPPGDGPAREDEQVGRVDPRAGRARIEGDLEAVREVLDREGGGDGRQPTGQRAEVTPDAGDEGERQDADVRDHARRVGVRDEAQDRDAQGAEARGSGDEREDEAGQRLAADLDPVGQ